MELSTPITSSATGGSRRCVVTGAAGFDARHDLTRMVPA